MKKRRSIGAIAPIVERKRRRTPGAQTPSPDRQIRAWRADDVEARELEAFNRQSDIAQKQAVWRHLAGIGGGWRDLAVALRRRRRQW